MVDFLKNYLQGRNIQKMGGFDKDNSSLAITAIIIAVLALSFGDAVIKATGLSLPLWQMYILRSCFAIPILVVILAKRKPFNLHSVFWISVRSILQVLMFLCYYASLPLMPLPVAAAGFYTAPIFITILAAILSRAVPSFKIIVAIFLGFGGVVLIIRPETSGLHIMTLLPVVAAIIYAVGAILTSAKCRNEDPIVLVVALNIAFICAGVILSFWSGDEDSFVLGPWVALNLESIGVIAILAVAITIGSVGAAFAYQSGPPVTIATFDYTYIVFSIIWGVTFFAEFPDLKSLGGMVIIVIAGLLTLPKNKTI